MKRFEMIKEKERFSHIIKNGKYNKDKNFVIYYIDNKDSIFPHFGIALKKSIGKSHIRNRLKRQTRCIIDNNKKLFKKDRDYIIMIREGCLKGNFQDMSKSLNNLVKGIK